MNIFANHAPAYWNAGLPAIPLLPREKRPAINRWQLFGDTFPTKEERQVWLHNFPYGNIGLPMGPAAGLVAIDIDTDDPKVLEVLEKLLPPSPWTRVGKKGYVRIYKYNGERTTRIKDAEGGMICEILSNGTQFVLPPSIHPDTGKEYIANADLWAVHQMAPRLPDNVAIKIRHALKKAGVEVSVGGGVKVATFIPAGARDNAMVSFAGLMSRGVLRGERTLLEANGEMRTWATTYVEQVAGDPVSPDKAAAKLIEFLVRDVTSGRGALPIGWDEGLSDADKEQLGLSFTDDQRQWSAQEIVEFLSAAFEKKEEAYSSEWMKAVQMALHYTAISNLKSLDISAILKQIATQSQGTLALSDVRKHFKEIQAGPVEGDNHQEIAQEAFERLSQFGEIRFDGQFWQWKGAQWAPKPREEILSFVGQEYGNLQICRRATEYEGVVRVIKTVARGDVPIGAIRGMNFANGFLDEQLQLHDHNPEQGMTYVFPYEYRPERADDAVLFQDLSTAVGIQATGAE